MPIFVGNRSDIVRTTFGHTITFTHEGAEVHVPDDVDVQKACIDRGHMPKKEPKPTAAKTKEI